MVVGINFAHAGEGMHNAASTFIASHTKHHNPAVHAALTAILGNFDGPPLAHAHGKNQDGPMVHNAKSVTPGEIGRA